MSRKFAVFVEGLTEQEFTIRLLTELAVKCGIVLEIQKQYRGTLSFIELRNLHTSPQHPQPIHVLIANCCNDNQVKQQIKDNYKTLDAQGYSLIVGLYDVYPLTHSEIQNVLDAQPIGLPNGGIPIQLHLAILEIEAWFLEEITHFSRIDSKITAKKLVNNGFDHNKFSADTLSHPSKTLDDIYKSVGKRYIDNDGRKKGGRIKRTVDALSLVELFDNTRRKVPSLDKFITSLETGLFSTT